MRRLGLIWGLGLGLALVGPGRAGAVTHVINVSNFQFSPSDITINAGDSVRWMRISGSHTTTSGTGPSDPQSGNLWRSVLNSTTTKFARKFNSEGTFDFYCEPHFPTMTGSVTVVAVTGVYEDIEESASESRTFLAQNMPNPFNASTLLGFSLRAGGQVELSVHNILGQRVRMLVNGDLEPGPRVITWDGTNDHGEVLASGVYFYRLRTADGTQTRKMVLLR